MVLIFQATEPLPRRGGVPSTSTTTGARMVVLTGEWVENSPRTVAISFSLLLLLRLLFFFFASPLYF